MSETCGTCKFWRRWNVQPIHREQQPDYGDCRRHAPALCHGPVPSLSKTKWPSTAVTDYCGSFKSTDDQGQGDTQS